ncbi:MAG: NADH-quinone oxidoreductase subunit NuoG [Thiobacillaceae bacterium]|nr:NADH-quinone oxidoreductase subunit NuoG [Thiobacillaceae bacterium]
MPTLTIDGKRIEVEQGATVMDAARALGIFIPHFCYHKKLSIAANCRMCLVEVEKAVKPLPACATPATEGMVVHTHSPTAIKAQKGVMELLLINHPLDCPICDQGGECQLQDLAVGYGGSRARYQEPKRVVRDKELGPLIATDMTRCIHCSRCVRFGQEIAGLMELGMPGRGEHTEVMTYLEGQVSSELSGNVIDLCPVGALTSKPFRFSARPWELARKPSISPHDGLGANLELHVKGARVYRVLPRENEAVNECWLADRDRFAYQALHSEARLTRPMVRDGDQWQAVDWPKAIAQAAGALQVILRAHGPDAVGFLLSPHATLEELHLAQKLARALGCAHIDHRLDRSAPITLRGVGWLGLPIAEVEALDRALLVGATIRKEQPLIAQRLRKAVKDGAQLSVVHAADDDLLTRVHARLITKPSGLVEALARVAVAMREAGAELGDLPLDRVQADAPARAIAQSLLTGDRKAVFLGAYAQQHPAAGELATLAQAIARACGATLGLLVPTANGVGAALVGAQPAAGGFDAAQMLAQPRKAYVLLGCEPDLEAADPLAARAALAQAELVVALTAFGDRARDYAHVLLPIATFAETDGSFVNMEGRLQTFRAAVPPPGEARPAWKVLRVLANQLGLAGFLHDTAAEVLAEALPKGEADIRERLDNTVTPVPIVSLNPGTGLERLAETPIYQLDPLVRRAPALQATLDGEAAACCFAHGSLIERLGLTVGKPVRVRQGAQETVLRLRRDDRLPPEVVRVAAVHPMTARLGPRFGEIGLERM